MDSSKVSLGIITAMDEEMILLREHLKDEKCRTIAGFNYYEGLIEGVRVVLLRCGIGKVSSAVGASLLINNYNPKAVINSGSAGGMSSNLNVLDLVVSSKLVYHDADATAFGYKKGQVPGMPLEYEADKHLMSLAVESIKELNHINSHIGLIGSGDSFISCPEHTKNIKENFAGILAVEMEGASIAQTCYLMQTPFVVIRAISDIPGQKSNYKDFKEFVVDAGKISAQMVINIIKKY